MHTLELTVNPAAVRRGLLDVSDADLVAWLRARGQPPMRARQTRRWLVAGRATSLEQMTDLPLSLRQALANSFSLWERPSSAT